MKTDRCLKQNSNRWIEKLANQNQCGKFPWLYKTGDCVCLIAAQHKRMRENSLLLKARYCLHEIRLFHSCMRKFIFQLKQWSLRQNNSNTTVNYLVDYIDENFSVFKSIAFLVSHSISPHSAPFGNILVQTYVFICITKWIREEIECVKFISC